jgi:hypothetical protein
MTPEQRKEAESKKEAHKASKGIAEGADAPVDIVVTTKPRRGRKAK